MMDTTTLITLLIRLMALKKDEDRKARYEILESKMSLPEPKMLACPHAPPPSSDAHFPTPAEVQSFLKREGIDQYPATFCMEWWLESNGQIENYNEQSSGLSRHERYKIGVLGGEEYTNEMGVTHWRPTATPIGPPSWDNPEDAIKPATPSRDRSDEEKLLFTVLWKKLYRKLHRFGLRRLGGSEFIAAWLSDVRLAMLTAYWSEPNTEVVGLGTKELPPLVDAIGLIKAQPRHWEDNQWGVVFRRLARQWRDEGSRTASGSRRQNAGDKATVQDSETVLKVIHSRHKHPSDAGGESVVVSLAAEVQALSRVYQDIRLSELPDCWQTECLKKVARSLVACPDATRAVQIEHSGLGRSTFMQQLARIKKRSAESIAAR